MRCVYVCNRAILHGCGRILAEGRTPYRGAVRALLSRRSGVVGADHLTGKNPEFLPAQLELPVMVAPSVFAAEPDPMHTQLVAPSLLALLLLLLPIGALGTQLCGGTYGPTGSGPNGTIQGCLLGVGRYQVSAAGARGGSGYYATAAGGRGAVVNAIFVVRATEVRGSIARVCTRACQLTAIRLQYVQFVVGQAGANGTGPATGLSGGGGGGSFVFPRVGLFTSPYLAAGGGGGASEQATDDPTGTGASAGSADYGSNSGGGAPSSGTTYPSGGFAKCIGGGGAAGAGWQEDGSSDAAGANRGGAGCASATPFLGGASPYSPGGYGGGGAGGGNLTDTRGGGGGGGASGGGGGCGATIGSGGGGGTLVGFGTPTVLISENSRLAASNNADGFVQFTKIGTGILPRERACACE